MAHNSFKYFVLFMVWCKENGSSAVWKNHIRYIPPIAHRIFRHIFRSAVQCNIKNCVISQRSQVKYRLIKFYIFMDQESSCQILMIYM